jgi:hypothetical protein
MAKPPRVLEVYTDEDGEDWAILSTVGSPKVEYIHFRVPKRTAGDFLKLAELTCALYQRVAHAAARGDPTWERHAGKLIATLTKLAYTARRGRPKLNSGAKLKAEQHRDKVRELMDRGMSKHAAIEATSCAHNVTYGTVERCCRKLDGE